MRNMTWRRAWRTAGQSAAISLVVLSLGAAPGFSQTRDVQSLGEKLDRLERDLQDVQRQVYSRYSTQNQAGDAPSATQPAPATGASPDASPSLPAGPMAMRVDELDQGMRALTGDVERLNFRVDQIASQISALSGDIDFRLRRLEQNTGLAVGALPTAPQGPRSGLPDVSTIPKSDDVTLGDQSFNTTVRTAGQPQMLGTLPVGQLPGTAAEQYEAAKQMLIDGNFAGAETAFARFVQDHGDDELAGEAQYWLGEAFYVRGAYQESGRVFAEGLAKYPNGSRGPDTLLKLGMSLAALNEKEAACTTFNELDRRFPDSSQTVVQRVKVEKSKIKCR